MQIEDLPGVEPHHALSLRDAGIWTCQQLLHVARCPNRLAGVAEASRLPMVVLRDLINRAELSQLQGVGPANLTHLVAAGVPTLSALAAQEPDVLRLRLGRVTARPPNLAVVEHWIVQARRRQEKIPGQQELPAPGSCAD